MSKNPDYKDPKFLEYLEQIKIIALGESNNNYDPVQGKNKKGEPLSSATGKYQYLWKQWGDSIIKSAEKNGYDIKTRQDFINSPSMQEQFFMEDHYEKYQTAKKMIDGKNPLNLNLAQIGFLIHWEGEAGANPIITEGKLKPATYDADGTMSNPATATYLKTFTNNLKKNSLYTSPEEDKGKGIDPFDAAKAYGDYKKELVEINKQSKNLPEDLINQKKIDLQLKYQKQGFLPSFNKAIKAENDYKLGKKEVEGLEMLKGLTSNLKVDYEIVNPKVAGQPQKQKITRYQSGDQHYQHSWGNVEMTDAEANEIKTRFPNIIRGKNGKYIVNVDNLNTKFNSLYKEATGQDFELFEKDKDGNLYRKTNQTIDVDKFSDATLRQDKGVPFLGKIGKGKGTALDKWVGFHETNPEGANYSGILKTNFDRNPIKIKLKEALVPIDVPETVIEDPVEDPKLSTTDPLSYNAEDLKKLEQKSLERKQAAEANSFDLTNSLFKDPMKIEDATNVEPQYKDPFPFAEAISGALSVAMGINLAEEKLPMRDEMVSEALRDYTAKLSRLSEIGLTPEEEAYAKRNLSESYQGSMDMITRASAGNRNQVLGNLGRVDSQKQMNLLQLSMADNQAKMDNFSKYGEALKFINDFDANRDIVNNERKFNVALMNKQAGGQLMASGFKQVLDSVNYYNDNKAGSTNHQYKSFLERTMFDVDSSIKDNGKGDTKFTPSYNAKRIENQNNVAENFNQFRDMFIGMPDEKKSLIEKFANTSSNLDEIYNYMNTVNEDQANVNPNNNVAQAKTENDHAKIFQAAEQVAINSSSAEIVESVKKAEEVVSVADQQKKQELEQKSSITNYTGPTFNNNFNKDQEQPNLDFLNSNADKKENVPATGNMGYKVPTTVEEANKNLESLISMQRKSNSQYEEKSLELDKQKKSYEEFDKKSLEMEEMIQNASKN